MSIRRGVISRLEEHRDPDSLVSLPGIHRELGASPPAKARSRVSNTTRRRHSTSELIVPEALLGASPPAKLRSRKASRRRHSTSEAIVPDSLSRTKSLSVAQQKPSPAKPKGARRRHSISGYGDTPGPTKKGSLYGCIMARKQFELLRETFREYDINHQGWITKEDFIREISRVTPGIKDHAEAMFHTADRDGNGQLDFCEFLQMYSPTLTRKNVRALSVRYGGSNYIEDAAEAHRMKDQLQAQEEQVQKEEQKQKVEVGELQKAFGQWLKPGKETLSMKTIRQRCPLIRQSQLDEWIGQHGTSGEINIDEFVALCSQHYGVTAQENALKLAGNLDQEGKGWFTEEKGEAKKGWFGTEQAA